MGWTLTDSLSDYLRLAGRFLRTRPVQNSVLLTVLESLRESGATTYGDAAPMYGWHETVPGQPDGAFLRTPPHPVLLAGLPPGSATSVIELLAAAGRPPPAANLAASDEAEFAAAWRRVTGGAVAVRQRTRLFRLDELGWPEPLPAGTARVAGRHDADRLISWTTDFGGEAGSGAEAYASRTVSDKLSYGGLTLWEAGGRAVAMAGVSRNVAGVTRVTTVYTPPGQRRHGYGGAVTSAVSQAALDAGAAEVILFTDLANRTSNALYARLGYRPLEDRVNLALPEA